MNTIGSRIAQKRKALNLTQEELALQLGVSSQAVSKWENDISCPDIVLLPALANALSCTTDALLSGKEDAVRVIPSPQRKDPNELVLRIKINSVKGDKVRVNLPFAILKVMSDTGMDIAPNFSGMDALKNIDMQQLLTLVENGTVGKLVEIESADGDTVEIVVE